MDIDYTKSQEVYNLIRSTDSKALWNSAQSIATIASKLNKANQRIDELTKKSGGANIADIDDTTIRSRAREVLWSKLDDGTIQAAEFAQFKDVFGLANAESDLSIVVQSYEGMCTDCQRMNPPELVPAD